MGGFLAEAAAKAKREMAARMANAPERPFNEALNRASKLSC
jgi:hypothetical protein